jgi:hypothetical protein
VDSEEEERDLLQCQERPTTVRRKKEQLYTFGRIHVFVFVGRE